jgi:hypothetical protein
MLAYIAGSVDQELLLRNEYLLTENRILRRQIQGRLRLTDAERISLAELGKRLGRKALAEVAQMVRPETILGWHRKLVPKKFDGSKERGAAKPAPKVEDIEELVVKLASQNRDWGYRRLAGALNNLGHSVSHQTVANIPKRHGLPPGSGTGQGPELGRVHSLAPGGVGGGGLLYGRGLDRCRVDDLLRAELYASGLPPSVHRWNDHLTGPTVDGADGAQSVAGGGGISQWVPLSPA